MQLSPYKSMPRVTGLMFLQQAFIVLQPASGQFNLHPCLNEEDRFLEYPYHLLQEEHEHAYIHAVNYVRVCVCVLLEVL